jgi:hypothetical protein
MNTTKPRSMPTTLTTSAKNDFAASLRCLAPPGPDCLLLSNPVSLSLNPRLLLVPPFHEERDCAREALV